MNSNRFDFGANVAPSNESNNYGAFLVATEKLTGSKFERSVVLLMQDDQRGTFGVALNKPANESVRTAWKQLTGADTSDAPLVAGGPLQGPVFALHQLPSLSDVEMPGGLHVSAQVENIQQLVEQYESPYRIFVGIAGWQPGQLQDELESGLWYSLPLDVATVFDDPDWMWEMCVQEYGRLQIEEIIGQEIWLDDPSLN